MHCAWTVNLTRLRLLSQAPIQFWDQPTRGLDSRTALDFIRTLRQDATTNRKSITVTTYQAGNDMYEAFDKVLVLAEGHVLYYGPRAAARSYFESLGFVCPIGANVADFLTSVTVETEREIAPGFEDVAPKTAAEFAKAYEESEIRRAMMQQIEKAEHLHDEVEDLKLAVEREKRHRMIVFGNRTVYTAGLGEQIINCTKRYADEQALERGKERSKSALPKPG